MGKAFKMGKGLFAKGLALAKHLKEEKAAAAAASAAEVYDMTPSECFA